ncbi:TlpA family protein disulfide reductase [Ferruginibacter sp.]|nr:redoxin family protein [Ferruginibacter sp.]
MKYLSIFFSLLYFQSFSQKTKDVNISINIENGQSAKLYFNNKPLSIMGQSFIVVTYDSAILNEKNKADFKIKINHPQILAIELAENGKWCSFIASPGDSIKITGTKARFNKSAVIGSYENDLLRNFEKNSMEPILQSFIGRNMTYDSLKYHYNILYKSMINFILENQKTFSALLLLQDLSAAKFIDSSNFNFAKGLFTNTQKYYQSSDVFDKVKYNFFELPLRYKVGDTITKIAFETKYLKNTFKKIKANSKFILIDFWATWCAPCLAEMPYLDTIYQKYHSKGFEILSISSDVKQVVYNNFLKNNNYQWLFYSDYKGQQSKPIKQFRVISYPSNFLLNSKGVIIAINIKAEKLKEFLLQQ